MIDAIVMDELAHEMYDYYTVLLSKGLPNGLVQRMVGDFHEMVVSQMLAEDALGSYRAGNHEAPYVVLTA